MAHGAVSILLYGDSGDGKTAQLGVLAEHIYTTTRRKLRVYTADGGGWDSIQPHVDLGIVEIVDLRGVPRPWEWINKVVQGCMPDAKEKSGWSREARLDGIGGVAYEGLTGFGDILLQDLAEQAANGLNIGGSGNVSFTQGEVKVGGNNMAHYGVIQGRLSSAVAMSERLPVDFVVWTAMARRGQDPDNLSTILGPQAVGKAMTADLPRMFKYCLRLMVVPGNAALKKEEEHRLYLRDHVDMTAAGARGMGNDRTPLDATPLAEYIAPADVVKALAMIERAKGEALAKLKARVDAAKGGAK